MKRILSVLASCLLISSVCICADAAHVSGVETNYPEINVTVDSASGQYQNIDASKVTASLGETPLKVSEAGVKNNSVEWIVLADTSISVSNAHFDAEKKAIIDLYKSLDDNDKLSFYTFDTNFVKVLDGTETPEEAAKKINAVKCTGQDTAFYDVLSKVEDLAKASTADRVIPMIYTDGVDTLSKTTKEQIVNKLKTDKVPIYGMYADVLKADTVKSFNSMLKKSGGKAFAFKIDNASSRLINCNGKADSVSLKLVAEQPITANEQETLTIDLGDGKPITKKLAVEEYIPETTTQAPSAESTETTAPQESTSAATDDGKGDLLKMIIPAAAILVLGLVALILVKAKKGKKDKKEKGTVKIPDAKVKTTITEKTDTENSESDNSEAENSEKAAAEEEKKAKKEKKKKEKDEQQFQFYFEEKKK